jgi:methylated-DNA-[protein]-cysteine S-methyltransferase
MAEEGFLLFDSAIGRCGIAWGPGGVRGVQLPERGEAGTRARLQRRFPRLRESPPLPEVQQVVESIVALLRGEAPDLGAVALDLEGVPPFDRRVYQLARTIPPGETLSYGELARRLGTPGAARAVGQALGRNPLPIVVPCHRVVAADGRVGGFSADGGVRTKVRLLSIEAARNRPGLPLYEGDGAFRYDPAAALEHLRRSDPTFARVIDTIGPFRLELRRTPSLFAALTRSIVYQQLSGHAAATIHARLCGLFPNVHQGPTAEQLLRTPDEKLLGAGLSRAKLLSLRDLASRAKSGEIPTLADVQAMDDEDVIERLTPVRGIGRWTVEMLLIFRLGRPDVLPVDDLGVRKGCAVAYGMRKLPTPAGLEKRARPWRPYRSVASWYLWRMAERGSF